MLNCKKLIALSMSAALALSLCACSKTAPVSPAPSAQETQNAEIIGSDNVQIPNPWADCDTAADAAALAGFDFTLPEELFTGASNKIIQAAQGEMIQVIYADANGNEIGRVRKAAGSEDVSGDYNDYSENETTDINGTSVKLRGKDGKIYVATWEKDGCSYSLSVKSGLAKDSLTGMVASLLADAVTLDGGNAQIPNPWVDCDTMADAAALAGFDFTAPDALFDGTASKSIQAVENDIIQVIYFGAENNEIGRVRKGAGSGDVSGDYNDYAENETADVGGVSVRLRGTDGNVFVMTWTSGNFAYSVTTTNGMARDAALGMVSALK